MNPLAPKPVALAVWLTGMSGVGKSTLARALLERLHAAGLAAVLLDGDEARRGLCSDLGFSAADRGENVRRLAEVARLLVDQGVICVVAAISPFQQDRDNARERVGPGRFKEVFVDAPLEVLEARDTKGLYAAARRGDIAEFTGISSPYERPLHPDLHLCTSGKTAAELLPALLNLLDLLSLASAEEWPSAPP